MAFDKLAFRLYSWLIMDTLAKNSLIMYKQQPGLVKNLVKNKIIIEVGDQEIKVRPKDLLLLHPGPLYSLAELQPIAGDMLVAWELLAGTSTTLADLAELAFGHFTPVTAWASWQWVADGLYFYAKDSRIAARPQPEVRAIQEERAQRAAAEAAWDAFVARLGAGTYDEADKEFLLDVEAVALERSRKSRALRALDLAQNRENAHDLLLRIGFWDEAVNPYPQRLGVEMGAPTAVIPSVPDEQRRDLTHLLAFAIDDEGSTDADDAVSLGENGRLWVHIADVAACVAPDSAADLEARARGANLYLPEQVIPMLPAAATDLLALGRSDRSPALSFGLELTAEGAVAGVEIVPSWIRVTSLSYEVAEAQLHQSPLQEILALAKLFQARRHANGAVIIDLPEAKVRVTADGRVEIRPLPDLQSRLLVREAMLMTGAAVAQFARQHEIPLPFTVQVPPDWAEIPPATPSGMFARRKGMKRSQRSREPGRHAGLGMDQYVQATSPLRRYLDMVVHQQLRAFLRGDPLLDGSALIERVGMADAVTGSLRAAERLSNQHWTLVYLQRNPGWQGEGIIIEKRGRRCVVMLPDLALETDIYLDGDAALDTAIQVAVDTVNLAHLESRFRRAGA